MLNIQEINNIKYKIKMLDIEEFSRKLIKKSRLMGIDPGKKRVGIAISDENRIIATPLKVLVKNNFSICLRYFEGDHLPNSFNDNFNV